MGVIPIHPHPPGSPPEPATPALHGQHWWHARTSVLEGQRQAYADEVARITAEKDETVEVYERAIREQNETMIRLSRENVRLRADLAQAGLAIDALTAPKAAS